LTALGGCIDWTLQTHCRSDCNSILRAQARYSPHPPRIETNPSGAFGAALFPTLPEDSFDRQPLREKHLHLVADVRLDNRDELIRQIGIEPSGAMELADADVLLRAWLRWGEDCLDRIVGDFAFAVFCALQRKLTLVRDPLGGRPLFFRRQRNRIAFASMPSGLLAISEPKASLDLDMLSRVVAGIRPGAAGSYFNGITKVLPGECISFIRDGQSSRTYWKPPLYDLRLNSPDEYVDAFREVLRASVEPRLRRRSGPVCTDLSSGFDSSAVSATAGKLARQDEIIAFTAAPREGFKVAAPRLRFPDESVIAKITATMNGLPHVIVRPSGAALSQMRSLVAANQDPYFNYVNLGWIADLNAAVRDAGGVIELNGEYGNQTLHGGGINVLGDFIAEHRWVTWAREAWLTSRNAHVRWRGVLINSFQSKLPSVVAAGLYRWSAGTRSRAESVFLRREWVRSASALETDYAGESFADSRSERLHVLRTSDVGQLRKGNLALFGIDQRAPLGDRRAIEFGLRLPSDQLLHHGELRPLARRALRDRLPPEVLDATSRGYQAADWFEQFQVTEIREMVEEISGNGTVRSLIDTDKMHRTLDEWPSSGFETMDAYQRLALDLPLAIGTGLFIINAEKWLAASS
jgi:asparagine synthase (glutamine-hydrolysing)